MLTARRHLARSAALTASVLVLGGCGNADRGSGTDTQVDITSTAKVYIFRGNGADLKTPLEEVDNLGPNTSRDVGVKLDPGTYLVVCKPGQTGDGIRTPITVTKSGN